MHDGMIVKSVFLKSLSLMSFRRGSQIFQLSFFWHTEGWLFGKGTRTGLDVVVSDNECLIASLLITGVSSICRFMIRSRTDSLQFHPE